MNGIDGFLGKPSIVLDARIMLTGAKSCDAAGSHAEFSTAAAFGGHLADLSRQDSKGSDSAALASLPNHALPALVQQNFLLATGTAEAAVPNDSKPETGEQDAHSTIASPQAANNKPDGAKFTGTSATGPGGTLAMVPAPVTAGAGQGVRTDALAVTAQALMGDASFADGAGPSTWDRPVMEAFPDLHSDAVSGDAGPVIPSPLAPGFPLLRAYTAAIETKAGGSIGTSAPADAAMAKAASVSETMREMLPLGVPPAFPHASRAAGRPWLVSVLASLGQPAEPHESSGMEELPGGLASFARAAGAKVPVSVPVAAAGDIHGFAASIGPAPLGRESALDSAVAQERLDAHAKPRADSIGGRDPGFAAPAPVGFMVVNLQTHYAPANWGSPAQMRSHSNLIPVPGPAAGDAHGLAPLISTEPLAGGSTLDGDDAQAVVASHVSLTADKNGDHGLVSAAPAPVGFMVVNLQTHYAPANWGSPAQMRSHSNLIPVPGPAAGDAHGLAPLIGTEPLAGGSTLDGDDVQENVESHVSLTADNNGDHGLVSAEPAPVKGLAVDPRTHLAPPNQLSPAQQIAGFVVSGAGPDHLHGSPITAQSRRALDVADMTNSRLSVSQVRTMQLQLDPGILGKVTVRMKLSGTQLDLRVETERPETMQLISKETDLLTSKLQAAGYAIETLIIRQAEPHAQHQQFGVNAQSSGQDQPTGQANGGPSAHDRPSTHDGRQRSRPVLADDSQDSAGVRHTSGDVYL